MRRLLHGGVFLAYLGLYWVALRYLWRWVPMNTGTDLLALFILLVVLIPLAAISADHTLRLIKDHY